MDEHVGGVGSTAHQCGEDAWCSERRKGKCEGERDEGSTVGPTQSARFRAWGLRLAYGRETPLSWGSALGASWATKRTQKDSQADRFGKTGRQVEEEEEGGVCDIINLTGGVMGGM